MSGTVIGLSNLVYAKLTSDTLGGIVYGTVQTIAPAIEAKINPNASTEVLFADDGPSDVASTIGKIDLELNPQDVPMEVQADLLGHIITGGVIIRKSTDIAPYVAVGFKALKSNGGYRYIWLLKGLFAEVEQDFKTREDKVTFQTPKLKGMFLRRVFDAAWIKQTDTDMTTYVSTLGTNWFNAVESTPSPLTCTAVPIQGATGVSKSAPIISWTYSNAILSGQLSVNNFMVINSSTGAVVAGTLAIDSSNKIVTLTPSSALTASTLHIAVADVDVQDIYGQKLVANTVASWTTGA
ncbi:MAG: Ig-like domain-containing protein [Desulfosporosinus sp.]|nr:Ig-like domain-containing protein [Desulfosporosinus sp.]